MLKNTSKLLFAVEKGSFNRLDANTMYVKDFIAPNESFKTSISKFNDFSYTIFKNKATNTTIDSVSCIENIGGLDFYCFKMNIKISTNMHMHSWSLKRIFKDKIVSINLNYVDPKVGQSFVHALKKAKFI